MSVGIFREDVAAVCGGNVGSFLGEKTWGDGKLGCVREREEEEEENGTTTTWRKQQVSLETKRGEEERGRKQQLLFLPGFFPPFSLYFSRLLLARVLSKKTGGRKGGGKWKINALFFCFCFFSQLHKHVCKRIARGKRVLCSLFPPFALNSPGKRNKKKLF